MKTKITIFTGVVLLFAYILGTSASFAMNHGWGLWIPFGFIVLLGGLVVYNAFKGIRRTSQVFPALSTKLTKEEESLLKEGRLSRVIYIHNKSILDEFKKMKINLLIVADEYEDINHRIEARRQVNKKLERMWLGLEKTENIVSYAEENSPSLKFARLFHYLLLAPFINEKVNNEIT
ncbi:MAG: hypothetical protein OEX08_02135 [Candidatus Nomurabacteria bacterium]|nr:hypothetical protein [Candidatus Nomurabacteria bacterium]